MPEGGNQKVDQIQNQLMSAHLPPHPTPQIITLIGAITRLQKRAI